MCARCVQQGQPVDCGNPIQCAFLSGVFSSDNWNCATMNALRELADVVELSYRDDLAAGSFGCVPFEDGYIAMTWYKERGTTGQAIVMRDDDWPRYPTLADAEAALDMRRPWSVGSPVSDRTEGGDNGEWGDVRQLEPIRAPMMFAFPPCTDLAVSGARDFKRKGLRRFIDALELVECCRVLCSFSGGAWMLENPVSRISSAWREPDYRFQPCDYGDPYTKKTCLWIGGGFVIPEKNGVEPTLGSAMHKLPPSANRANLRSATPEGFARAVFIANHQPVQLAGVA